MKKKSITWLFFILVILQITVPLSMIVKKELLLKNGVPFCFKTVPVDPTYDPFRGRYMAIRVEANNAPKPQRIALKPGQKIYAEITANKNEYAKISQITTKKPNHPAFLEVTVDYITDNVVFLKMPITRYYIEEKTAARAEKIYKEYNEHNKQDSYVVVRIKNGSSVVEELHIGDQKI